MALLTVTGYVRNGDIYFKDPFIRIEVHFLIGGIINAEAHVYPSAISTDRKGSVPFNNVAKSVLDGVNGNGYDGVIAKLETALRSLILANNAGTTVVIS